MKRTLLLSAVTATFAVITLNSNSSGPASNNNGNRTGGPGSLGTCASCHSGATGATGAVSLKLKSDNSPANGKYTPGATYIVNITGTHASLPEFGFQIMALKDGANTQAGTFGNLGTDKHSKTISGITLVEQQHPISKTGGGFTTEFEWTAPATGTGNVKFYGVLNAVDGTGNTSGDAVSPAFDLTLAEATNTVQELAQQQLLQLYPNPVKNRLHITTPQSGTYELIIYNMTGKVVLNQKMNVISQSVSIPVDMAAGTYILELKNNSGSNLAPFVVQ